MPFSVNIKSMNKQKSQPNNKRRKARGLPTYEPSYELAIAVIRIK